MLEYSMCLLDYGGVPEPSAAWNRAPPAKPCALIPLESSAFQVSPVVGIEL